MTHIICPQISAHELEGCVVFSWNHVYIWNLDSSFALCGYSPVLKGNKINVLLKDLYNVSGRLVLVVFMALYETH